MSKLAVVVGGVVAVLVAGVAACSRDADGGPAVGPSLTLTTSARGVQGTVRRKVVLLSPNAAPSVVSMLDTAVWAPFDESGAAAPAPLDAGIPGPVARVLDDRYEAPGWRRSAIYFDSAGVLHELMAEADGPGPATHVEYRRAGRLMVVQEGRWTRSPTGWMLEDGAVSYLPADGSAVRVELSASGMVVTRARPGADLLKLAGGAMVDWVRPAPLAAQFHFRACTSEWLVWGGAALLAEAAWVKFAKSRLQRDFKMATAATATAGVALDKLVDCMLSQRELPTVE